MRSVRYATYKPGAPGRRKKWCVATRNAVERQRWFPQLEGVDLPLGHVLCESGITLSHVYFPTTAIISMLYVMEDGASAELALDRLEGNQLVMTPERIANMLGLRREGVTEGALKLQHTGLIQYAHGRITVLEHPITSFYPSPS